jgi:HAD superfamily phosphatase (TIGR01668 family)
LKLFKTILFLFNNISKNNIANYEVKTFCNIDLNLLKQNGIKYIISDIDQTIVSQNSNNISKEVLKKIRQIEDIFGNKSLCFLTNEYSKTRAKIFCHKYNLIIIDSKEYKKPLPNAFMTAISYFGTNINKSEICFIGDRIFTDIIGANCLGMYTIKLQQPYNILSDNFITKLLRKIENII